MAAATLAVILATQPPQQHPKGVRLIFIDATGVFDCGLTAATTKGAFVLSRTPTGCVGFTADPEKLALGLAPGGIHLGGSHHHRMRLGGSHHQGCICFVRKHHRLGYLFWFSSNSSKIRGLVWVSSNKIRVLLVFKNSKGRGLAAGALVDVVITDLGAFGNHHTKLGIQDRRNYRAD
uniref:Uncharacterized protein n=1 Tax=Tanacetum cinerariifolium TaxID=118510 RepID=A0A699I6F5_TANCI|nr:hypothetical protein [Tanacetum cinerariifolium]